MKKAQFLMSHFESGQEKFKAGECYPLTEETGLCIARGAAVEVDAPDEPAAEAAASAGEGETEAAAAGTETADAETSAAAGKAAKAKK